MKFGAIECDEKVSGLNNVSQKQPKNAMERPKTRKDSCDQEAVGWETCLGV